MDMGALAPVVFSSTYISVVLRLGLHFGSNNLLMISTHEIPKSGPGYDIESESIFIVSICTLICLS